MRNNIQYRNSNLINKAYEKLVGPDISARLCGMLVMLADSLIAARWIGISAVSAIALVAPLTLFEQCLHDFFVSGITQVIIKYKSRGLLNEANRAFGTILADTFLWYVIIYVVMFFCAEDIFQLYTSDETLISDALLYFIPVAVTAPFSEAGLCLERGFKTDGRNGFFGVRAVITNIMNIIFSVVAVQVFNGGIRGISIASCAATLLGYCWSGSHFFSGKCTTRPDFSALTNRNEARKYLREERAIGSVYALDDGLYAGAMALLNKAYLLTGGTSALAAVGVTASVTDIISSVNGAIQTSAFNLCGLFHSDRDHRGTVFSLRTAFFMEAVFGAAAWIVVNVFYIQIGIIYKVQTDDVMAALHICLMFSTLSTIGYCFTNLFSSFMIAVERTKQAAIFAIVNNVLICLGALIGFSGINFFGLLIVYALSPNLIAAAEAVYLSGSGKVIRKKDRVEISSESYLISENTCAEISEHIFAALASMPELSKAAPKMALLAEECCRLILYVNQGCRDDILADMRITADETECVITLVDTGVIFDPIHRLEEKDLPEEYAFSRQILKGFSPKATYARIVDLNVSHLILSLSAGEMTARIHEH